MNDAKAVAAVIGAVAVAGGATGAGTEAAQASRFNATGGAARHARTPPARRWRA